MSNYYLRKIGTYISLTAFALGIGSSHGYGQVRLSNEIIGLQVIVDTYSQKIESDATLEQEEASLKQEVKYGPALRARSAPSIIEEYPQNTETLWQVLERRLVQANILSVPDSYDKMEPGIKTKEGKVVYVCSDYQCYSPSKGLEKILEEDVRLINLMMSEVNGKLSDLSGRVEVTSSKKEGEKIKVKGKFIPSHNALAPIYARQREHTLETHVSKEERRFCREEFNHRTREVLDTWKERREETTFFYNTEVYQFWHALEGGEIPLSFTLPIEVGY